MKSNLGLLVVVLGFVACGGTSETGSGGTPGGSSSGGTPSSGGSAGKSGGGSGNVAGSVSSGGSGNVAGSVSMGGSGNVAGSVSTGGSGGAGSVDERCPDQRPMGACTGDESGASCQYNPGNGCLCYRSAQFVYPCPQVDPMCGSAGSGGAASAPPPQAPGAGGISAKIALPPTELCTCTAGNWSCTFGI